VAGLRIVKKLIRVISKSNIGKAVIQYMKFMDALASE